MHTMHLTSTRSSCFGASSNARSPFTHDGAGPSLPGQVDVEASSTTELSLLSSKPPQVSSSLMTKPHGHGDYLVSPAPSANARARACANRSDSMLASQPAVLSVAEAERCWYLTHLYLLDWSHAGVVSAALVCCEIAGANFRPFQKCFESLTCV